MPVPKIVKVVYSPSQRVRYQIYSTGEYVGFRGSMQTAEEAKELVLMHIERELSPRSFLASTEDEYQKRMASAKDWITIYEAES